MKDLREGRNIIVFKSADEYMKFRNILSEKIERLQIGGKSNIAHQTTQAITILTNQKVLIDVILGNIFFNSMEEELAKGIKFNPVLYPELTIAGLPMNGEQIFNRLSEGINNIEHKDTNQKRLEFKDEEDVKLTTVLTVENTTTGEKKSTIVKDNVDLDDVGKAIYQVINSGNRNVASIMNAAKKYCELKNINIEEKGYYSILKEMSSNYSFIKELPHVKGCSKWVTKLIIEHKNPVIAYWNLRERIKEANPRELGQFIQWLAYFNADEMFKTKSEIDGLTKKSIHDFVDGPYYFEDTDCNKVKCNKKIRDSIMKDTSVRSVIEAHLRLSKGIGSQEAVEFEKGELSKLVQEALDYVSPVRKWDLAERRKRKMSGELQSNPYVEKGYPEK